VIPGFNAFAPSLAIVACACGVAALLALLFLRMGEVAPEKPEVAH
jgi:hypothetical protein